MSEQAKPIDFVRLVLGTLLLSEDEVECLAHLGRAIFMAKQTPTDWKPLASIGVHAMGECLLGQYGARPSNWPGNELFGQALEPLEAMLASFTSRSDKDRLTVEDQRNRFYLKFAMGYVLTARGDMDEGRTLLRDLVETPLSTRGGIIRSGTEILDYSHDLAQAKF